MMINFDGTNFNSLVAYCHRYSKKWLKHLYPNFGARDEIPTSKQYERSKSNQHEVNQTNINRMIIRILHRTINACIIQSS